MNFAESIARLRRRFEYTAEARPRLVQSIQAGRQRQNPHLGYLLLSDEHRVIAMVEKYVNGDEIEFRQNMHVACRLEIKSSSINESRAPFETAREIFHALLSDNPELIKEVSLFKPSRYAAHLHDPLNPQFLVHMWQLAVAGDYASLESKAQKLAKNGRKPLRTLCAAKKDFFSLLMAGDKAGLEARIEEDCKVRNDDPITADFFTYLATFEAKLCWYKGIEVQIGNPCVPMDLMPIRPLAHYDDVYDFLKPDWIPPKPRLLDRIRRLVGR